MLNKEANFSIVLPGGCNASCDFCFWGEKKMCSDYIRRLKATIASLPDFMLQVSLTGGEVGLSPVLDDVLYELGQSRFVKKVITSNGTLVRRILAELSYILIRSII